jgi:hypothetical protein
VITHTIDGEYFRYGPAAGHLESCRYHGTDMWEVSVHRDYSFQDELRETKIRLACLTCGVLHYEWVPGEMSSETSNASELGYGSVPERVLGVYLWAGPKFFYYDDHGPEAFLITLARERPATRADVLGAVAWSLGPRGGIKWRAGLGCSEPRGGAVAGAHTEFASRRSAVKWVTENQHLLDQAQEH